MIGWPDLPPADQTLDGLATVRVIVAPDLHFDATVHGLGLRVTGRAFSDTFVGRPERHPAPVSSSEVPGSLIDWPAEHAKSSTAATGRATAPARPVRRADVDRVQGGGDQSIRRLTSGQRVWGAPWTALEAALLAQEIGGSWRNLTGPNRCAC